jgi:hypothetical protein
MICPGCGRSVDAAAEECPLCGRYLTPADESQWSLFDRAGQPDRPDPPRRRALFDDPEEPAEPMQWDRPSHPARYASPSVDRLLTRRSTWPSPIAAAGCLLVIALVLGALVRWWPARDDGGDVATIPRTQATQQGNPQTPAETAPPPSLPDEESLDTGVGAGPLTVANAVVTAAATAPAGTDAGGNPVSYEAANVTDGDPTTTWRMPGDGRGVELRFDFPQPVTVTGAGLINGYAKLDPWNGADRYAEERRILAVTWAFDGGGAVHQDLVDGIRDVQRTSMEPVTTTSVILSIGDTTPPGDPARDYTAISEVDLTITG